MDKYLKLAFQVSFSVCSYNFFFVSATIKTCSNNSWSESAEGESKFSKNLTIYWGRGFLFYFYLQILPRKGWMQKAAICFRPRALCTLCYARQAFLSCTAVLKLKKKTKPKHNTPPQNHSKDH